MAGRIYDPDGGISWDEEQAREAMWRQQAEEHERYAAMERDHLGDDGMDFPIDAPCIGDDFDQRPYDERLSSRFEEPTMPGTDLTASDALASARADGLAAKRALGIPSFEQMADDARAIMAELFPTAPQLQERLREHARTRLSESRVERGYERRAS